MLTTLVLAFGVALGGGEPIHRGPRPETCGEKPAAPVVVDEDLCVFEGRTVRIALVSPTGCWSEDDMTLTFEQSGKKVEARWPGEYPTSWWMLDPGDPEWNVTWPPSGSCQRVDAVRTDDRKFLLFLRKNGRPNSARLVAILYDADRTTVLDMKDIAAEGDLVARAAGTVWFRERELGEGVMDELVVEKEDELPLTGGNDRIVHAVGNYAPINPVWRVAARQDRIVAVRDLDRTFELYKDFFPSVRAFETAFAWEKPDMFNFVREGRTRLGRKCIQPHRDERLEEWRTLRWYCSPPK